MPHLPIVVSYIIFTLFILIQVLIGRKFGKYRQITASYTDKRVHAFNEFIHGCPVIKMYNWEKPVEDRISRMRQDEFDSIQCTSWLRVVNTTQFFILPPLLSLTTFGTAWLLGYRLNAADSFTALSLFALIRNQVMLVMPLMTETLSDVQLASKRIDTFMRLTMIKDQPFLPSISSINQQRKRNILISHASFSWIDNNPSLTLLNLVIESGACVGIVGAVGSGKSSLLAAILGEMNLVNGQLNTNDSSFSYAAQLPWIFADTIRNNILLNRPFDEQRYRNVIYTCCLDVGFFLIGASGDRTVIGESGVNLSGGQKARVSLARALYTDADIYLIDDPLAAVDQTVAKQTYERYIGPRGLLKNKTRLLVTHQTQFLIEAHQIIFLSHGQIDEHGRLDETITKQDDNEKEETSLLASIDESTSTR